MSEFALIQRHFARPLSNGILGVGDDCALLPVAAGALAVSTDLLIEGRHFFSDVVPARLGYKALAVNLSDLAAMGARPLGALLGIALPSADDAWLSGFMSGWQRLAERYQCPLVGGDTTRTEAVLTLAVTVIGQVDARRALRRDGARPDDDIWVSGSLGSARLALKVAQWERTARTPQAIASTDPLDAWLSGLSAQDREAWWRITRDALEVPEPRLSLGQALVGHAHAAIDLSDGLLQDLSHVCRASACGAVIDAAALPLGRLAELPPSLAWANALAGGDDYELCFTLAPEDRDWAESLALRLGLRLTRIGTMRADRQGVTVLAADGAALDLQAIRGFDHFGDAR